MYVDPEEHFYMHVAGASSVNTGDTGVMSAGWHFVCAVSDGAKIKIYADGILGNEATLAAGDLSNSSADFNVGIAEDKSSYPMLGSLSLLRVSATVPTPQQVKEIYDAEKPLFQAGAKCLLQGGGNSVDDLNFDAKTSLLTAATGVGTTAVPGATIFRGLEAVDTFKGTEHGWSFNSIVKSATAGGVSAHVRAGTGGGVLVDLPALDVRAELNEGEDKTPNDGKLHFEGVTNSATKTVLGTIPIVEGEHYMVTAKVLGHRYQEPESTSWRINGEIKNGFTRDFNGNIVAEAQLSKLIEAEQASLDLHLEAALTASRNVLELAVTGSGTKRMVWKASVEVQRISDKTYER